LTPPRSHVAFPQALRRRLVPAWCRETRARCAGPAGPRRIFLRRPTSPASATTMACGTTCWQPCAPATTWCCAASLTTRMTQRHRHPHPRRPQAGLRAAHREPDARADRRSERAAVAQIIAVTPDAPPWSAYGEHLPADRGRTGSARAHLAEPAPRSRPSPQHPPCRPTQ